MEQGLCQAGGARDWRWLLCLAPPVLCYSDLGPCCLEMCHTKYSQNIKRSQQYFDQVANYLWLQLFDLPKMCHLKNV